MIGGVIDIRRMLRDLAGRTDNPLDDGRVEEHVSLDAAPPSPRKPGPGAVCRSQIPPDGSIRPEIMRKMKKKRLRT